MAMGRSAIVLGGGGQIGRAVTRRLLDAGWAVKVVGRGRRPLPAALIERGATFMTADRTAPDALRRAVGAGADALIDVTAYDAEDGRQLLELQRDIGALLVVSSSSVYRDAEGRTLDEARQTGFPALPDPIPESQAVVEPGDATYSTRKVALERVVLDGASCPVSVLRPAAIHGPGSTHPREWWFVKRMLDGRPAIPLAYRGRSRFHTSSVLNIAELVAVCLDRPGTRILNIADPQALSVGEIGTTIARRMRFEGALVGLDDDRFPAPAGRTPWSVPRPFVLDTRAAEALGYAPVADYGATTGEICDDLAQRAAGRDWREAFPILAGYPYDLFDYAAEDEILAISPARRARS
ncbi:NAD-dependent epimerase/dehydratase family protein [Caulobacter hibisci]|uniref:NAD-dependent epimerase/dehydratase family protein n=1 Tax=Caulobacter hibisci TaxID=2035993 RepID=A0ABS0T2N8_9CAUL|nr:NAD-dependent epimerase/dehydratase family protein [Caulobacter hibisci]MBI1686147.1 NAD-dependent epimerase/dehydratase family protein [Caulobacter hibisci]